MSRKIVLTSHINLSGTRADVFVGNRPLATIYRADGAWHALTQQGTRLLPRMPHTVRDAQTRREREIPLGVVIKMLRERLNGALAAKAPQTA
jgi:hypothetical protein